MAIRKDEAVTAEPLRVSRVEVKMAGKEDVRQWGQGHGSPGMARVGALDHVHGEAFDGGNALRVKLIKNFTHHSCFPFDNIF